MCAVLQDESLARLGLDYVDIIQVHDVEFCPDPTILVNETLPGASPQHAV
jgi:aryl-alcohol dehydrogenase-like predicted oxidoreductase